LDLKIKKMEQKIKNAKDSAFASVCENWKQDGLTKLEYFAGLAMQGLLTIYDPSCQTVPNEENIIYMAKLSVKAADELLKALDQ
jgi:hypothetical protein